ncbi:hypothetical protein NOVOSPHI9U_100007 [Novosphingobium sp. 9U]|nr:hypothetical protein NOVOSPHI9U_100007 [Novosphingobium sp. 9U]
MGFFDFVAGLLGGSDSGGAKERYRHKGRYGPKGAFRKERNGDRVGRGKNGRYKK